MIKIILILIILFSFVNPCLANSNYEIVEVAKTISAEAGGEGYEGMYLVANTIKNRAKLYHKSPYEVVKQKNQYYGFTAKNRDKIYKEVKLTALFLADNIMKLPDKTNGALYFRRPNEPMFYWCKIETIRYKNHIFYK